MKKNWIIKFYDVAKNLVAVHILQDAPRPAAVKYMWELIEIYKDTIDSYSLSEQ